ncbi:MAG: ABC transporter ATP-binding protein [Erysipelotrichia bacterium]|nr:ABC transporter ATP-binding protein [Erysipelotrichia bacterium]NCC54326.1 ABC transporter ATP-binding protein [Erysipelotrichia bacterium]
METSITKKLMHYLAPYKHYLFLAFIGAIGSVVFMLLVPSITGDAIDYMVAAHKVAFKPLKTTLFTLACIIILAAFFQWLLSLCANKLAYLSIKDLRITCFHKLQRLPIKSIDSIAHGDIISRIIQDIDLISDGLIQTFSQLFNGILLIVLSMFFMYRIQPLIASAVLLLTPISLFVAYYIVKNSRKYFNEQSKVRGQLSGHMEEMIDSLKLVKVLSYEKKAVQTFHEINHELLLCGQDAQFYSSLSNPSTRFISNLIYALVTLLGALLVVNHHMSVGELSAFLIYANQYNKPFNELSGVISELQNSFASAKRVFDFLEEIEEVEETDKITFSECVGNVFFQDVSFSYDKKHPFIEHMNIQVKAGTRVAIVGATGCGKTTLINLLMRFYDIDAGRILIDGIDIERMSKQNLRSHFGMVLQDSYLFSGTIRDNILYGKADASEEEVILASKKAMAHNFIKRLENGYDTLISEGGSNLSAGQKQLICIARIMLMNPPMLILDEATSNIDTRSEILVQKAFANLMKGHTSFVIAHRLSTIKEADIILFMDHGKILERGTHEQLLALNQHYANLYHAQFE